MSQTKIEKAVLLATAVLGRLGLTTKGDLIVHDGVSPVRLPVAGVTGKALVSNPAADCGLEWGEVTPGNPDYVLGEIRMFAYDEGGLETGWIPCDGRELSESTYSELFAKIGYTWGAGETPNTFLVPKMGGRSPAGAGSGIDQQVSFAISGTSTTNDTFTVPANSSLYTGRPVVYKTDGVAPITLPSGEIENDMTRWIIRIDSTTVALANTQANAVAGVKINIITAGTGNQRLVLSLADRAVASVWGEDYHNLDGYAGRSEIPAHTHAVDDGGSFTASGGSTTVSRGQVDVTGSAGDSKEFNVCGPRIAVTFAIWTNYTP